MVNEHALLELAAVAPSNHRWPSEQTEGDRGKRHHLLASFPLFLSPSPLLAFTELYAGVSCELGIAASEKGQVISQENPQPFAIHFPGCLVTIFSSRCCIKVSDFRELNFFPPLN